MTTTARAWIGCLASYNAGTLHGQWVDLEGEDELAEACEQILKTSPEGDAEELWVMDHEGLPIDAECSPAEALRYGLIVTQCELAGFSSELVAHALECLPEDEHHADTVTDWIQDRYAGTALTPEDWAEQFAEDTGQLPEGPFANYIDWKAYARDLQLGGDVVFLPGGDGVLAVWGH